MGAAKKILRLMSTIYLKSTEDVFNYGKYRGRKVQDIIDLNDLSYIDWCSINMTNFLISGELFQEIDCNNKFREFSYEAVKQLDIKSKKFGFKECYLKYFYEIDDRWFSQVVSSEMEKKLTTKGKVMFSDTDDANMEGISNLLKIVLQHESRFSWNEMKKIHKTIDNETFEINAYDYSDSSEADVVRTLRSLHGYLTHVVDRDREQYRPQIRHYFYGDGELNFELLQPKDIVRVDLLYNSICSALILVGNNDEINRSNVSEIFVKKVNDIIDRYGKPSRNNENRNSYDSNSWLEDLAGSNDPEDMNTAYWNID